MPHPKALLPLLLALTPAERAAAEFDEADPVVGSFHVRVARVDPSAGRCEQASASALRLWATASPSEPITALRVATTKPSVGWLYHVAKQGAPPKLVSAAQGLALSPQQEACLLLTEPVRPSCSAGERWMLGFSRDATPPTLVLASQRGDGIEGDTYTYGVMHGGAAWIWTLPRCEGR